MSFDVPAPPYGASDPLATFVSSSCLDFLLIELVPMAFRLANELAIPGPPGRTTASSATASGGDEGKSEKEGNRNSAGTTSVGGLGGSLSSVDEEERREAAYRRLEMLGYRVGQGLAER
ncbi:Trafficking protein particle complex subunit 33 [Agyrium rufum]|nr:Trafficking protein particle complex subunit 33 [Agyrium rufum]